MASAEMDAGRLRHRSGSVGSSVAATTLNRLAQLHFLADRTILRARNPVTGLFVTNQREFPNHAWVRDNVYTVICVWALHLAYRKAADTDEDMAKANELGAACVKTMQSLMECMMQQCDKIERFKYSGKRHDSLHAKFDAVDKVPVGLLPFVVTSDHQWGHLQIDAVSLYLLILAQITASGLPVVRNTDEVAFIQNLVYYIEEAYRIPDFGIWERGDKTNQGVVELNCSSIGMAKAAMQALNDVGDLYGDGSKGSGINVLPDEIQQCAAVLSSMLPRESFSKETDASLLSIVSFPAFAVEDPEVISTTIEYIEHELMGKYGCRRFLRDGYRTVLEDSSRVYYHNSELQQFENIECEWPLFFCYFLLNAMYFRNDSDDICRFRALIKEHMTLDDDGFEVMGELFLVPTDKVAAEKQARGSQNRVMGGRSPYLWAQSLYIVCELMATKELLLPAELDPLSRRLSVASRRPPTEVQIVILAENDRVKELLAEQGIKVENVQQLDDVFVLRPASVLARVLHNIGRSSRLGLTGRPMDRDVGLLSTSKLYQVGSKFVVFEPQFMEQGRSYMYYDMRVLMDEWRSELGYLHSCWNNSSISGRPLVALVITDHMLKNPTTGQDATWSRTQASVSSGLQSNVVVNTLHKIKDGYLGGAQVLMKNMIQFFRTTSVSKLEIRDQSLAEELESGRSHRGTNWKQVLHRLGSIKRERNDERYKIMHKQSMRHRNIMATDSQDLEEGLIGQLMRRGSISQESQTDLQRLRLRYYQDHPNQQHTLYEVASPITPASKDQSAPDTPSVFVADGECLLKPILNIDHSPDKKTPDGAPHLTHVSSSKVSFTDMTMLSDGDVVEMLGNTDDLDEQLTILHFLLLQKQNLEHAIDLKGHKVTLTKLLGDVYQNACYMQSWGHVRLAAGLLGKKHSDLPKAVTHLLVRQKQLTVGTPSVNEETIMTPKSPVDLQEIFQRVYDKEPNANMLAQEIIVILGSLVRTDPKLFVEMFRLRIGLIVQILASELALSGQEGNNAQEATMSPGEACEKLLEISPYQLKHMLYDLLRGKLYTPSMSVREAFNWDSNKRTAEHQEDATRHEQRSGLSVMRKKIEERKSRRSMRMDRKPDQPQTPVFHTGDSGDESEAEEEEPFVFGVWLRHRRIDGALNRIPQDFYPRVWDSLRRFRHGIYISDNLLHWGLTQEMTRREVKFALHVEQVLNQVSEPEYRQLVIEGLSLLGQCKKLLKIEEHLISMQYENRPFTVDHLLQLANQKFVDQNAMFTNQAQRLEANARKFAECRKIIKRERRSGQAYSGLSLTQYDDECWLPWHLLGNALTTVHGLLLAKLAQYKDRISGVLVAFGDIELGVEGSVGAAVVNAEPVLPFPYRATVCVFKPNIGNTYNGVIRQSNEHGTIAAIHGRFHCHVKCKKKSLNEGQSVLLTLTQVKVHNHMVQLHADLHSTQQQPDNSVSQLFLSATPNAAATPGRLNLSSLFTPNTLKPKTIRLDDDGEQTTDQEDDEDAQQPQTSTAGASTSKSTAADASSSNGPIVGTPQRQQHQIKHSPKQPPQPTPEPQPTPDSGKRSHKHKKKHKHKKESRKRRLSECSTTTFPNEAAGTLGEPALQTDRTGGVQLVVPNGDTPAAVKHNKHKHKRIKLDPDAVAAADQSS